MSRILIVDDDAALRAALAEVVTDLGLDACEAHSGEAALVLADRSPVEAALIDLRMPGMDGLELLRRLRALPNPPVVSVLTAHASAANTIEAMRLGAFDHLTKPAGRTAIADLVARMLASREVPVVGPATPSERLVGASDAMRTVQKVIGKLADSDASVLIVGETGTGKELVARAIHDFGARKAEPFVAVNCASIPSELLESELFGHLKGAFTGAIQDRVGAFRQADRGTLFLDEIGDMDLAMQPKILRALQERVVTPVGGKPVPVRVRVIAATHRDLTERIREGLFREDLYYRLHVVPVHLPPLRERITDIVPLALHFLQMGSPPKSLSPDAAARLVRYAWPGNVRELRNAMERAAVLSPGRQVTGLDLLFLEQDASHPADGFDWPDEDLPTAIASLEKMLIARALNETGGNRSAAAQKLNINRQLLYAKLKRYGFASREDPAEPQDDSGQEAP